MIIIIMMMTVVMMRLWWCGSNSDVDTPSRRTQQHRQHNLNHDQYPAHRCIANTSSSLHLMMFLVDQVL